MKYEIFDLRDEELMDVVADWCIDAGILDEWKIEGVVKWVNSTIINGVILSMIHEGKLEVLDFNAEDGIICRLSEEFKALHPEVAFVKSAIWKEIEEVIRSKEE